MATVVSINEVLKGHVGFQGSGDVATFALDPLPASLDLTHQSNLGAVGLDDRVSTGRINVGSRLDPDPLLEICGSLADALFDWWDGRPPSLSYRTRSMPTSGRSVAFSQWASPPVVTAGMLRDGSALHAYLVLRAGVTLPGAWTTSST